MTKKNTIFQLLITLLILTGCSLGFDAKRFVQIQNPLTSEITPVIKIQNQTPSTTSNTETVEVITLTEDNSVVMDQAFDDGSVSRVMVQLQKLADTTRNQNGVVYLVLNSPGGSVDAGLRLISFIKGLPLRVKTLTLFGASMAFQTAQNLDERLILDTGTLMSHRARFGVEGEAPGELFSRLRYIMGMIDGLDVIASRRMGMTFDAYRDMIKDEYWVYGRQAVVDRAADRVVLAKCGKGLDNTQFVNVDTMFGTFRVEISKCPLIPGLLSIQAPSDQKNEKALQYVKTMFSDKNKFVNEYVTTGKYLEFQK